MVEETVFDSQTFDSQGIYLGIVVGGHREAFRAIEQEVDTVVRPIVMSIQSQLDEEFE